MHAANVSLQALRVQYEAIFQSAFEQTDVWAPSISTEVTSTTAENLYGFLENDLDIREWLGEREIQATQEQAYRLKNKHYEGTRKLNLDQIADDSLGLFASVTMPMFAQRVAKWDDRNIADFLLNNVTAYDGLPFFDVAGAVRTYTNSTNLELQSDGVNFNVVRAALKSFVDTQGQPRYLGKEFTLVVPPQLETIARRIVEAEWNTYGVVGTDGAAMSSNVNRGLAKVLVIEELAANNDRWFLLATGLPIKPFLIQKRQPPEFQVQDSKAQHSAPFNENMAVYGVDFRSAYGVTFPWLAYASDPDGAMT